MPETPLVRTLYPQIEPHTAGHLDVGDGQQMYYEVSGNPDGKPVVFLHGGPGGGTGPRNRRVFDPTAYRIVLLDQRGCGRSTPHVADGADLAVNTTQKLIADMVALRVHLNVDRCRSSGAPGAQHSRSPTHSRTPSTLPSWCCGAYSCCAAA